MNKEKLQKRFLRDPLSVRLGGISATLGRISSSAREAENPEVVTGLLDEVKHLIEWTAAEATPDSAGELVEMQLLITLWQRVWTTAHKERAQRTLLSVQAKHWSDRVLQLSGLLRAG